MPRMNAINTSMDRVFKGDWVILKRLFEQQPAENVMSNYFAHQQIETIVKRLIETVEPAIKDLGPFAVDEMLQINPFYPLLSIVKYNSKWQLYRIDAKPSDMLFVFTDDESWNAMELYKEDEGVYRPGGNHFEVFIPKGLFENFAHHWPQWCQTFSNQFTKLIDKRLEDVARLHGNLKAVKTDVETWRLKQQNDMDELQYRVM